MKTLRQFFLFMGLILSSVTFAAVQTTDPGLAYFNQGQFDKAAEYWEGALSALSESDSEKYIDISLRLSAAYQSLGHLKRAKHILESARKKAEPNTKSDPVRHAKVLLGLGDVYLAMRDFQDRDLDCGMKKLINTEPVTQTDIIKKAEDYLKKAVNAITSNDHQNLRLKANIWNSKGNAFFVSKEYAKAFGAYEKSVNLANQAGDKLLSAKASINLFDAKVQSGNYEQVYEQVKDKIQDELERKTIFQQLKELPDSLDKAFALMNISQIMLTGLESKKQYPPSLSDDINREIYLRELYPHAYQYAYDALIEARNVAISQKNNQAMAYANLYLAQIYVEPERYYKKRIRFVQEDDNTIVEAAQKYLTQYTVEQEHKHNKYALELVQDAIHCAQSYYDCIYQTNSLVSERFKVYLPSPLLKDTASNEQCQERCESSLYLTKEFSKNCKGICQTMAPLSLRNDHPELLFRLERQLGILWKKQGQPQKAIEAYQRAVKHLQFRRDYRTVSQSFRDMEEKVYFELADLHLQQARKASNDQEQQEQLKVAIDHIESFKEAELRNYFQDECLTETETKTDVRVTDDMSEFLSSHSNTAIFYPLIFEDRIELLLAFHDGSRFVIEQVDNPTISVKKLYENVHAFRNRLNDFERNPYAPHSKDETYSRCEDEDEDEENNFFCANELYKGLIEPINTVLDKNSIDTLVIISHDILLITPFGALYNRKSGKYLIEDYALAVTPGWKLTDRRTFQRNDFRTLLMGISKGIYQNAPLPSVTDELKWIVGILKGKALKSDKLENHDFTIPNVEEYLKKHSYSVIHFSTHGDFNEEEPNKSFLLAYDGNLKMKDLEMLIHTAKSHSQKPLELLNLSACWTAMGNERAALGLSGMALKTGAGSVIGTLWPATDRMGVKKGIYSVPGTVEDEELKPTAKLMKKFYEQLMTDKNYSKAKALQQAQIEWFKEQKKEQQKGESSKLYDSPSFWAPFILIGNWL
jgi:CHAT domain-containing protein